ncbi:hypothetical protein PIROE2DRAFT_18199 [Piromyces sp. E2]|nr:hypothetical protein PIROE2DRAFT_18199 [Piromyces sp. E2]|eukprot:OUM56967.1 hypothetical protein PIROE2DRAFT_18199 [Piromyces sp. E2]
MDLLNQCDSSTRKAGFIKYGNAWTRLCQVIHPENLRARYMSLVDDLLSITKPFVFNSILLRRRRNIIVKEGKKQEEKDLDRYYQKILEEAISKSNYLPSFRYSIEVKKCQLLYCVLTVNGKDIEYENGKRLNEEKVIEDILFMKALNELMEEQTKIIRDKLNFALSLNDFIHDVGFYLDLEIVKRISFYSEIEMKEFSIFLIKELGKITKIRWAFNSNTIPFDSLDSQSFYTSYCTWLYNLERYLHYDENIIPMSYKNYFSEEERLETELADSKLKIISNGSDNDVYQIITNLFNVPEALSPQDQSDLKEFIQCERNHLDYLPETILNKENLVSITKMLLDYHVCDPPLDKILPLYRNVNDVLRLALVFSGHNAKSLGKRKRFKSFKNSERRLLMKLLNHCPNRSEDFIKYKNIWSRFCEKVHPSQYKHLYPDLVNDLLGTYRFLGEKKIKELRVEYRLYQNLFELDQRLMAYMNENVNLIQEKQYVSEEDYENHAHCVQNQFQSLNGRLNNLMESRNINNNNGNNTNDNNNNNNNSDNQHHPIDAVIKRNNEINKLLKRTIPFTNEEHQKLLETFQKVKKTIPKEVKTTIYTYLIKLSNVINDSLVNINNIYAQPWSNSHKRYKLSYYQEMVNGWKENSGNVYHGLIPTLEIDIINDRVTVIQPYLSQSKEEVRIFRREHQPFNSRYVELLNKSLINEAAKLLSQKPGLFLRQINELLMKSNGNYQFILQLIEQVAPSASIKVLLGLKGFFQKRNEKWQGRAFLIKGSDGSCKKKKNKNKEGKNNSNYKNNKIKKHKKKVIVQTAVYFKEKPVEPLTSDLCQRITHLCDESLQLYFEKKPKLNGVYLCPDLQTYLIPQDMREVNESMEHFTKGTRFGLSFKNITKEVKEKIISDLEEKLAEKKKKSNEWYKKKKEREIRLLNLDYHQDLYDIQRCKNQIDSIEKNLKAIDKDIERVACDLKNQKKCPVGSTYNYVRLFIIGNTNFSIEIFDDNLGFKTSVPPYHIIKENLATVGKKRNRFGARIRNFNSNSKTNLKPKPNFNYIKDDDLISYDEELEELEEKEREINEFKIYYGETPTNCIKYIDINFEAVVKHGGRYIVVNVGYGDDIKFGWMEIRSLNSDTHFEPSSIRQTLSLNRGYNVCPVILDCFTREFIWIDYNLPYNYYRYYEYYFENVGVDQVNGNANTTENTITYNKYYIQNVNIKQSMLYYYLNPLRISISDLIHLHIKARGGTLLEKEEDLQEGDTAFVTTMPYVKKEKVNYVSCDHLDVILSEYMKYKIEIFYNNNNG